MISVSIEMKKAGIASDFNFFGNQFTKSEFLFAYSSGNLSF